MILLCLTIANTVKFSKWEIIGPEHAWRICTIYSFVYRGMLIWRRRVHLMLHLKSKRNRFSSRFIVFSIYTLTDAVICYTFPPTSTWSIIMSCCLKNPVIIKCH